MDMGEKIKKLREEQHLTLEELGNKIGVGKSTVRKWENGIIANMRRDKIAKIADALGCSPSYLMGWDQEKIDAAEKLLAEKAAADDALEAELLERLRQIDMEQIRTLNEILVLGLTDAEMKDLLDYARFLISKRKVD